jgi:hypothetical protein
MKSLWALSRGVDQKLPPGLAWSDQARVLARVLPMLAGASRG